MTQRSALQRPAHGDAARSDERCDVDVCVVGGRVTWVRGRWCDVWNACVFVTGSGVRACTCACAVLGAGEGGVGEPW